MARNQLEEFARRLRAEAERDLELYPNRPRPMLYDETENHRAKPRPYATPWTGLDPDRRARLELESYTS
jgi:hypothetical protein